MNNTFFYSPKPFSESLSGKVKVTTGQKNGRIVGTSTHTIDPKESAWTDYFLNAIGVQIDIEELEFPIEEFKDSLTGTFLQMSSDALFRCSDTESISGGAESNHPNYDFGIYFEERTSGQKKKTDSEKLPEEVPVIYLEGDQFSNLESGESQSITNLEIINEKDAQNIWLNNYGVIFTGFAICRQNVMAKLTIVKSDASEEELHKIFFETLGHALLDFRRPRE